jgi:hypothetical protein
VNILLVTVLMEEFDEGRELISHARLLKLLLPFYPENADKYAKDIMCAFGCIPTSLALNENTFYNHTPEDFTQEQIIGLGEAFDRFDCDSSGTVDEHELCEIARYLTLGLDLAQCKALIRDVDQNSDGELDFLEFLACIKLHAVQEHVQKGYEMSLFSFRQYALRKCPLIKDGSENREALKARILTKLTAMKALRVSNNGSVLHSGNDNGTRTSTDVFEA